MHISSSATFDSSMRKYKNGIALALSTLMLAACGGGGDSTATAGAAQLANVNVVQNPNQNPPPAAPPPPPAPPASTVPVPIANVAGAALTVSTAGIIDRANPFFKPQGNGRSCASCHRDGQGWSITPESLQARFTASNGTDPVFRLVDGANSPHAPDATIDQKRAAYSMLLTKGVIRVGLPIPAGAEFSLVKVDDPYGFASATELSLFRRPLPSTNLTLGNTVMSDARETLTDAVSTQCITGSAPLQCFAKLDVDLAHQANSAVRGHAEATADLTAAEQQAIVNFEKGLFTAQITDRVAGALNANGARGGPLALSTTTFYFGINALSGDYQSAAPFDPNVMRMYGPWRPVNNQPPATNALAARASIARGEGIFNGKPINIVGVRGINDDLRLTTVRGTCGTCHNAPNSGTRSLPQLIDIGVTDGVRRTADQPLYTLRNNASGELIETTDPARALITGKWSDVGRSKVPSLRALASRAPYFHNGSARDLGEVVRFYDQRFGIGFNPQEVADLTAFLRAL